MLLPALYWGLDLLWHIFFSNSPLLLCANLVLPLAVSLAAAVAWRVWSAKLSQCVGLGLCTLLGIYVTGPMYMLLQGWLFQAQEFPGGGPGLWRLVLDWAITTVMFPITTLSFSTYDATLPAPFLTSFGVWLVGRRFSHSQPAN